ncbi:MAG TPA: hypothetical protein VN751_11980, partial [Solirubrobacteraceae bacterium]|nr:hypothetical protein [Solirubrobacteraceae bacterium]
MRRRRRPMFASAPARRGPRWIEPGLGRRRRRRRRAWPILLALVVVAGAGALAYVLVVRSRDADRERDAAQRYARAWAARDPAQMWAQLDARSKAQFPRARFAALVARADREATVRAIRVGAVDGPHGGNVALPVTVRTKLFGPLRGSVAVAVGVEDGRGVVRWTPGDRLPGLRDAEAVRRRV